MRKIRGRNEKRDPVNAYLGFLGALILSHDILPQR